jgi:hypothetical protein
MDGYPVRETLATKAQPWKALWDGPQKPSEDGKLLVACPKCTDYGVARSLLSYRETPPLT